jgi:hypothetical protein
LGLGAEERAYKQRFPLFFFPRESDGSDLFFLGGPQATNFKITPDLKPQNNQPNS